MVLSTEFCLRFADNDSVSFIHQTQVSNIKYIYYSMLGFYLRIWQCHFNPVLYLESYLPPL